MDNLFPADIKGLSSDELKLLPETIRDFLITSISQTGGHIGANLSVIELTVALHRVFDSPKDPIIFDTGHQGYTHKLLTGRKDIFLTLNTFKGMSRFVSHAESEHDTIEASHAGTSISIGSGIAWALKEANSDNRVIIVIGDGSMVEGMAFEGLNFASTSNLNMVIVLNDNEMAIAPSVGGMRHLTTGQNWQQKSKAFFEGLGLAYISVTDGHDINALVDALSVAKSMTKAVLVHVKTEKGKGLPSSKTHPYKIHFSMPFDPVSGAGAAPTVIGKTFASEAAEQLLELMRSDPGIVVITPATPYASYLQNLATEFPHRVIDVGMAEQQAVGMACGLALRGMKPVVCMQTTFMQRAFDQLLHDVCFMNLPVTILGVRSGFAGYDSPTHHGIYDIPYLRSFPNMRLIYPYSTQDIRSELSNRLVNPTGPMVILHPYEVISGDEIDISKSGATGLAMLDEGDAGVIFFLSNAMGVAKTLHETLRISFGSAFRLCCVKDIKPAPTEAIANICKATSRIICIEEGTLPGGFGSMIGEILLDRQISASLLRLGIPDIFVPAGNKQECLSCSEMSNQDLLNRVTSFWPDICQYG
ncbi:MAG: 1-deoxy-D-xylulose-5-phosphate synthase [Omnitrophica WOR_2 bacterium RIFCSPLOWO2_12_FULL_51_8]|nr:MAG: 1-deoxy-D-xylulose-5-phosphate synthase [Omnitrophica WOR_2 bacterium RIFCSPLOWO2_12_FULL_51_8]